MTKRLAGKAVLITGSGRGIGRGIAKVFASEGAKVVVTDLRAEDCEAVAAEIRSAGGEAFALVADLTRHDEAKRLVAAGAEHYGALDVLVHNAGVYPFAPLEQLTDETLELTLTINLKACFWLTQAALPMLKRAAGGGRIVVTSSGSGTDSATPGLTHYSASKAGVTGFVRNAALELAPYGINVNGVRPGFITHEMTTRMGVPDAAVQLIASKIPAGRTGSPEDIANAMLFFASADSAYVTGQTLLIDGGLHLKNVTAIEDERQA